MIGGTLVPFSLSRTEFSLKSFLLYFPFSLVFRHPYLFDKRYYFWIGGGEGLVVHRERNLSKGSSNLERLFRGIKAVKSARR